LLELESSIVIVVGREISSMSASDIIDEGLKVSQKGQDCIVAPLIKRKRGTFLI